jgi:iron(III) transport system substrate-binding protein
MSVTLHKRALAALLVPVLALSLAACGTTAQPAATPTGAIGAATAQPDGGTPVAEADPEAGTPEPGGDLSGDLVVYTSRSEALIKPAIEAFEQANPGVEVVLLTGRDGELSAKMLEERANPQADVFINTDSLSIAGLGAQGLFAPNDSSAVAQVPAEYRADDGSWVGLTLRARVIMYNTNLVTAEEAPKSVFELTDPKWKGQVGAADSTNGSIQGHIAAMVHLQGEEKTSEFVKGLVDNDTQFFGGHTDVRKAVGAGELKLGFVNHYYYQLSKAEGAPVGVVYPDQGEGQMGVVVNSTNAGILKGAKHPEAAQKFVDYLLTPDGQKVFADTNYEYPIVPGVALAEGVQPLDGVRLADVTFKEIYDLLPATKDLMQAAGMP